MACARSEDALAVPLGSNARAALPDFRIVKGSARLPKRCAPRAVAIRIRSALTAFNAGTGTAFARHFTTDGVLVAYDTSRPGRAAIARFVNERYVAGDGWTAAVLKYDSFVRAEPAPRTAPARGVYRLDLLLTARGQPLRPASAKLVVYCSSGLIRKWAGPSGAF